MYNTPNEILRYARCLRALPAAFGTRGAWLPLFVLGGVEAALCAAYLFFPWLGSFGEAFVRLSGGGAAIHYPEHVVMAPVLLDRIRFFAVAVAGAPVLAAALPRLRGGMRPDLPVKAPPSHRGALVAVVLAFAIADLGIQRGVGLLGDVPIVERFQPIWIALAMASRPFLWMMLARTAYPLVVAPGEGVERRPAFMIGVNSIVVYALLAATAFFIVAPFDALTGAAGSFVESGRPALASVAVLVSVALDVPVRLALLAFVITMRTDRGVP